METSKRRRLETEGWQVGAVQEFLELTPEEVTLIEVKLALNESYTRPPSTVRRPLS